MNETLIKVDGASKKFCRSLKKSLWYGLQDLGREVTARRHGGNGQLRPDEFWALKDVSFELKRGECLGLLGRNGAGKTTLLRMLNGLIKPDGGRIEMRGRVGALIALGAGFNPILTGRENVYVNGTVLGLTKREIDARLDEIIDFAEIREAIDAPVQSYSSGMTVRLGFAVATTLNPDVLLLDEVLAVGDAGFRHKCYQRLSKIMSHAAVILVSHNMDHIGQLSTRAIHLKGGKALVYDNVMDGISAYLDDSQLDQSEGAEGGRVTAVYPPIHAVEVRQSDLICQYGGSLTLTITIDADAALPDVNISLVAVNRSQQAVMCWHSSREGRTFNIFPGRQCLTLEISPLFLHDGEYTWHMGLTPRGTVNHCVWFRNYLKFKVVSGAQPLGDIPYLPRASRCILQVVDQPAIQMSDPIEEYSTPTAST